MAVMHYQLLSIGRCLGPLLGPNRNGYRMYSNVPTDAAANAGRNPQVSTRSPLGLHRCFPGASPGEKCPVPPCSPPLAGGAAG